MSERFEKDLKSAFRQKDKGDNENYILLLRELGQYIGGKDLTTQSKLLDEVVAYVNSANVWGEGEAYSVAKLGYEIKPTFVIQEETCLNCGKPIPRKKSGRPSKFCSVRCRVAYFRAKNNPVVEEQPKPVKPVKETGKKRKEKANVSAIDENQISLL